MKPRIMRIVVWVIIATFMLCACSGLREQAVYVSYLSKDGIKFKRKSEYLSKKDIAFLEDYIHKYAPFCNWNSDTIVMETITDMVSKYFACYALSTSKDSMYFSERENFYSELTQGGYPSIEDFYSPHRIGIYPPDFPYIQERIATLNNIKCWQTDSIEKKIIENGYFEGSCKLNRIIVKDGKITSVSTYYCCQLTFFY